MDDLIRRQLVLKTLCERRCGDAPKGCPAGFCTESLVFDCIPSADAVEVVRCKDCIHFDSEDDCECPMDVRYSDFFCKMGERRTDA